MSELDTSTPSQPPTDQTARTDTAQNSGNNGPDTPTPTDSGTDAGSASGTGTSTHSFANDYLPRVSTDTLSPTGSATNTATPPLPADGSRPNPHTKPTGSTNPYRGGGGGSGGGGSGDKPPHGPPGAPPGGGDKPPTPKDGLATGAGGTLDNKPATGPTPSGGGDRKFADSYVGNTNNAQLNFGVPILADTTATNDSSIAALDQKFHDAGLASISEMERTPAAADPAKVGPIAELNRKAVDAGLKDGIVPTGDHTAKPPEITLPEMTVEGDPDEREPVGAVAVDPKSAHDLASLGTNKYGTTDPATGKTKDAANPGDGSRGLGGKAWANVIDVPHKTPTDVGIVRDRETIGADGSFVGGIVKSDGQYVGKVGVAGKAGVKIEASGQQDLGRGVTLTEKGTAFGGGELEGSLTATGAGLKVEGGAFVGGKAGASVGASISGVEVAVTGEAWAGAGVEAAYTVGRGADGHWHIGGHWGGGFGTGGKGGVEITIDPGKAIEGLTKLGKAISVHF